MRCDALMFGQNEVFTLFRRKSTDFSIIPDIGG